MRTRKSLGACLIVAVVVAVLLPFTPGAQAATPHIDSITPLPTWNNQTITVTGTNFGSSRGSSYVTVGGLGCGTYSEWTDTKVVCKVHDNYLQNNEAQVETSGGNSNKVTVTYRVRLFSISPTTAHPGDVVTLNGAMMRYPIPHSGKIFLNGTQVPDSYIDPNSNQMQMKFTVSSSMTGGHIYVENSIGKSDTKTLTITGGETPGGYNSYLAEGCSNYGFDTYIEALVSNTGSIPMETQYMTPSGAVAREPITTTKDMQKIVIHGNAELPNKDFSFSFHRDDPTGYYRAASQRLMFWGNGTEGHLSTGVSSPSKTWYLAEGCTDYGFETWLLVQNPNSSEAHVNITYMTANGPIASPAKTVPANSRLTVDVNSEIPQNNVSIKVEADRGVIAERAMYWANRRGGTCSGGATAPSNGYYLAEGSTNYGFDEWILIQNPNSEAVTANITYLTYGGPVSRAPVTVGANSRFTIHANEDLPAQDFSASITCSKPIVAERAMYWNNGTGKAGHASMGASRSRTYWMCPVGHTESPYETYVLVANPDQHYEVQVTANFYDGEGNTAQFVVNVPAGSRWTINPAQWMPNRSMSTTVSAERNGTPYPVIAEEAIYWNNKTGGACALGFPY